MLRIAITCYMLLLAASMVVLVAYHASAEWMSRPFMLDVIAVLFFVSLAVHLLLNLKLQNYLLTLNIVVWLILFLLLYDFFFQFLGLVLSVVAGNATIHIYVQHGIVLTLYLLLLFLLVKVEKHSIVLITMITHIFTLPLLAENLAIFTSQEITLNQKNIIAGLDDDQAIKPDIFYIVPDGYTNNENLKQFYDFDNSQFTEELEENGFYIAEDSRANYLNTHGSLSSTLNLDYLDEMVQRLGDNAKELADLAPYLSSNKVMNSLHKLGYKMLIAPSFYRFFVEKLAEAYRDNDKKDDQKTDSGLVQNIKSFSILSAQFKRQESNSNYRINSTLFENVVRRLEGLSRTTQEPIFYFMHLLLPHKPMNVDDRGNFQPDPIFLDGPKFSMRYWKSVEQDKDDNYFYDLYKRGYVNNVRFFNTRFLEFLRYLKSHHPRPFIIMLLADHGWAEAEVNLEHIDNKKNNRPFDPVYIKQRSYILNAVYFHNQDYSELSQDIGPINTFRALFNTHFGTTLPYLKERSFHKGKKNVLDFIDVTDLE